MTVRSHPHPVGLSIGVTRVGGMPGHAGRDRVVSRPEKTRNGLSAREVAAGSGAGAATEGGRGGDGWRVEEPVLLGSATPARQPELPVDDPKARPSAYRSMASRPLPKGWPGRLAEPVWAWAALDRPPLPVVVGGAEGGVGTSTVAALIGELLAAASTGPTAIVDQCCAGWGQLFRRLVGQRAGLDAQYAATQLHLGTPAPHILGTAPTTSAGAALLDDSCGYTSLGALLRLVATSRGVLVVDAGRADAMLAARLDIRPIVVLVGRADVIGAEAICAALGFLQLRPTPVQPVVVLCSTASTDRRRIQVATKLVATTGISHLVHLPYDAALANGQPLRLDQVGKTTAAAGLAVVSRIGKTQEVLHLVRRPVSPIHAMAARTSPPTQDR